MFSYNHAGANEINDPIESQLEIVILEENPVYEALSYCWGDSTEFRVIKCNNNGFQVTESLFCALKHLRNKHSERTLWIDAICINQNDLQERQSQVQLMKDIYSKSERVVVWLGPDPTSDGINHLFELIQTVTNVPNPQLSKKERVFFEMNVAEADRWYQGEDMVSSENPTDNDFVIPHQAIKGAVAILNRPWWSRVWTVQEMVLAPTAIIMCGDLSASSSDVQRTCTNVLMHTVSDAFDTGDDDGVGDLGDLMSDPDGKLYIASVRLHRSFNTKTELGALLQLHRWLRAKDPRDKVYGCLGIAESTYGIEPDYTVSTVECYTRAAFNIISGSRSLDIFSALRRPSCIEATLTGLPSWVPDWSYDFVSVPDEEKGPSGINNPVIRENVRTPILLETRGAYPEFKASKSDMPFTTRLLSDGKTLVLRGFIVDEISSIGNKLEYPYPGPELPSNDEVIDLIREFKRNLKIWGALGGAMDTINGWQDLAFKTRNLQTVPGETRMDAFLTTLLSNRIRLNANRREVLDYLEQSIKTGFKMTKTGIVMNQLHLPHIVPHLYRKLLGYRKLSSIDWSDLLSVGKSFTDVQWAFDHRMAVTASGHLSLVPWPTQAGDRIVLLQSGRTPYVLRKAGDKWKIIGDCYVHGIMSGEAWSDDRCGDIEII
ncbi:heterokaryon incompatibility protein-domain-containing protein [Fusarium tricinctum]|uniref:Heterokaryon incompatibility protein-domain-containing protein n=1 Tax=Fusarium tricinctum TaxID=61284 RepID=A0A8K0S097_9HYPO|nr:heterokaryon incompatibility protein-domain-containing protein [Fusarium tricinctum]